VRKISEILGIVIIGRNEGERLELCFESMSKIDCAKVYVDSGSIDNSVAVAKTYSIDTIELNPNRPFSAARARNEGFKRLLELNPRIGNPTAYAEVSPRPWAQSRLRTSPF
jgi:glycosyltransferase involved in cell wall biosynthesis